MIRNRDDLKEYLQQDKIQLGITRRKPRIMLDEIWKYEIALRYTEYWLNQPDSLVTKVFRLYYRMVLHRKSVKLGISISPNTCGKGLSIAHFNCINVNPEARIGDNCRIHEGVTIGASGGKDAPQIGNNVFLASGCKIMGGVKIASRCVIGANAVVVHDIEEEGITVGGIPAKKISNNNSDRFIYWYRNRERN